MALASATRLGENSARIRELEAKLETKMTKRDKYPGAPGASYCCEPDCEKDAEFEVIQDEKSIPCDVAYTHACTDHVGVLLGSPLDGPEVRSWIVVPLARQALKDARGEA